MYVENNTNPGKHIGQKTIRGNKNLIMENDSAEKEKDSAKCNTIGTASTTKPKGRKSLVDLRKAKQQSIKNKRKKTTKKKNVRKIQFSANEYKVSSESCVWLCPNASTKDHHCEFALCDKCYMEIAPTRKRRRGMLPKNMDQQGEGRCNHKAILSLVQFFDAQYFTNAWKNKMNMENGFFPTACNKCNRNLVS